MRFTLDLDACLDQGQCAYSAPDLFSLDASGIQALRRQACGRYTSGEIDESHRDELEEAADMCPERAIEIID